jgi:hypothetical protein
MAMKREAKGIFRAAKMIIFYSLQSTLLKNLAYFSNISYSMSFQASDFGGAIFIPTLKICGLLQG